MAQILEQENQARAASAAHQGYEYSEDDAESASLTTLLEETLQELELRNFSRRIYQTADGHWYFRVRNRPDIGPFDDPEEAERVLRRHVIDCRMRNSMGVSINWPRTWSAMRLARRSRPRRAVSTAS